MRASKRERGPLLRISGGVWKHLCAELGRRGEGRNESGAVLLASAAEDSDRCPRVRRVVYFDDLGATTGAGSVHIKGHVFSRLWDLCEAEDLRVVADVHTHGGRGVAQSAIDQHNPFVGRKGHIALILPNFAVGRISQRSVGVHRYLGDGRWESWFGRSAARRLKGGLLR